MKTKKHKISANIFLWIVLFISSSSFADVTVDIPLEHPVYNNIDRLSSLGIFRDDIQSIRPITIYRLQTLIDSVDQNDIQNPTVSRDLRAIRDYLFAENKKNALQFDLQQGALFSNSKPTPLLQTIGTTNPLLNQKDQARFLAEGYQFWLQPRLYFNWETWAAFEIQPFIGMTENTATHDPQQNVFFRKTALKLGAGDLEISVGRMPIQWGQGFSGSLLFGGSQHPLDMIQIRNAVPVTLPSFLRIFGPAQFSGFVTKLDENQVHDGSFIIGERLAIKPHPTLELAFSQSIQLMGRGVPHLSSVDILSEIIGKRLQDINSVNLSNRNFSVDGSWKIPQLNHTKVYGELFWEDCCRYPFARDLNKLFGISYPELFRSQGTIAFEFVQTTEIYNRHGRYTSGFMQRGVSLGHPLGPDARGLYLKYHHVFAHSIEADLVNAYEIRGRNELDLDSRDIRILFPAFQSPERRIRHTLKIQKTWKTKYWASFSSGFERVLDSQYLQNQDRNQYMFNLETGLSF